MYYVVAQTKNSNKVTYTLPKLCDYNGDITKPWFVWFDIEDDTGQSMRKQYRGGINYYQDPKERRREGNALCSYWKKRLESGLYNPFERKGGIVGAVPENITEAITQIADLKMKSLKRTSRNAYTATARMFKQWLTDRRLGKIRLHAFTQDHARAYLDYLLTDKGYNNTSYNGQRLVLHALFAAITDRWKTVNPFTGIALLPQDIGKNLAYTEQEKRKLISYLKEHDKRMYYAVNFIYHAYIRKTELCEITVGHIDWESKTIRIDSKGAKNRLQDSVTITDGLLKIMLEMGLDMAPKEYYIFGRNLETCEFINKRPNGISDRHRELKLAAGLPDDGKAYYSWKHTGVIDYFKEIKDIYAVMRQCRHSDLKTTMIYLKSLGLNPNSEYRKAQIYL
jgi:integrase